MEVHYEMALQLLCNQALEYLSNVFALYIPPTHGLNQLNSYMWISVHHRLLFIFVGKS